MIDALFFALKKEGVVLRRGKAEELRLAQGRVVGVSLGEESLPAGAVILATGGLSYPATRLHGGRVPAGPVGPGIPSSPPRPLWFHWRRRGTPARRCRDFP